MLVAVEDQGASSRVGVAVARGSLVRNEPHDAYAVGGITRHVDIT